LATSSSVFPEEPSLKGRRREKEPTVCLPVIWGWVTEGFDTADLIDAEALLNELAVASGSDRLRYHACFASLKGQSQQPAGGRADAASFCSKASVGQPDCT
jgi:hypothetical protein